MYYSHYSKYKYYVNKHVYEAIERTSFKAYFPWVYIDFEEHSHISINYSYASSNLLVAGLDKSTELILMKVKHKIERGSKDTHSIFRVTRMAI